MLGNFSFGDYLKKEAIHFAYEYLTSILGIDQNRITVTVFSGEESVPYDQESFDIWHKEIGIPKDRISKHGRSDNFWGPTGNEGPCGPTTEIYVDGVEIWNLVFNMYYQKPDKTLEFLKTPGVDTGMGLERLVVMMQGMHSVFETDLFHPIILKIRETAPGLEDRVVRILADHVRASVFLIGDGVRPSNKEAGYILRRLLRRILAYQSIYDIHANLFEILLPIIQEKFGKIYKEIDDTAKIVEVFEEERSRFEKAIALGIRVLNKIIWDMPEELGRKLSNLYQEFGINFELSIELLKNKGMEIDPKLEVLAKKAFDEAFKKHQEISRAGVEKKFGGHGLLLDTGELKAKDEVELKKVTRLHTATHLLQAALRQVLGNEVSQKGSDITVERTRFDFSFSRKLTAEEIKEVEDLVNEVVEKDLPMNCVKMPQDKAKKTGALFFFKEKYPDEVNVYFVGHSLEDAFSKEFCGGPHVTHTAEVGKFKILKDEAVGSGARRIRATVG